MIVDYNELTRNENQELTDVIIANASKMRPDYLVMNPNPRLAPLILKLIEDAKVCDCYIHTSRNPGATDHIIKIIDKYERYELPCNPGLTDYIIKRAEEDKLIAIRIAHNPDPRLTKIIKDFSIKVINHFKGENFEISYDNIKLFSNLLSKNTNSELAEVAEVIMMIPEWRFISSNSNTGLTKFIIDNEDKLEMRFLSANTNPELAGLILKNIRKCELDLIAQNPNPGLIEFIKKYIDILDLDLSLQNPNPELAKLIIANTTKENFNCVLSNNNPGLTKFILDAIAESTAQD